MSDHYYAVRERAAKALDGMRWKPRQDAVAAWYWIARPDWEQVVALGSTAVEPLITVLSDDAVHIRRRAAEAQGKTGDARAAPALIAARRDADHEVRWNAATALGQVGDASAVEPLTMALSDGSVYYGHVMASLGQIGGAQSVQALVTALRGDQVMAPPGGR